MTYRKVRRPAPQPKYYEIACPDQCSYHPDKIGEDVAGQMLAWRTAGGGAPSMLRRFQETTGLPGSRSAMDRHVRHYREADPPEEQTPLDTEKLGDLDILDRIIQRGAQNSKNWKPTIKDTMEAMKLKMQITGNSAFDDMLAAMEAGLRLAEGDEEEDEEVIEAPEALFDAEERPEDEDLPDPVLA